MTRVVRRLRWWMTNLRIAGSLVGVSAVLHLLGLRRTLAVVDTLIPRGTTSLSAEAKLARSLTLARRIAFIAERLPRRARCLSRSLVLRAALRRRGIDADLRIGVRREAEFEAHAWVEVDGVPAGEPEDVRSMYAAFSTAIGG